MSALANRHRRLRAVLPMVALLAVTAVAAMLIPPPSPVVQAQGGTCAYAQTPGRLADLTFKTEDNTTWEIGKTNTFRSRGPYVGSVQVDATAGIEVSTDPAFSCGSGAQALTLQKGAGPTEIHVQRCDPEQRHIEFTTVLIDGCNGQIRTVYTWKWLEPTDAPVGISQQDYQQPNRETPGAPTTSSMSSSTCNGQNQNGGSNSPEALNPQETHRSEADGPGPTRVPYSRSWTRKKPTARRWTCCTRCGRGRRHPRRPKRQQTRSGS